MKDKITIGLFIDTYYPMIDGVCMVVDNYAKRLVKYANVIVFAPEYPGIKYDDSKFEYKVVRCKSLKLPIIDYSLPIPIFDKEFKRELNNYKLDLVHIHSPFTIGKIGIDYAKKRNIPIIGTMHSQYKQDFLKIVIKQFNRCDECWAVNSEVARIFYEDYKYKTKPKVMNNATEMEPLKDKKYANRIINEKYGINEN